MASSFVYTHISYKCNTLAARDNRVTAKSTGTVVIHIFLINVILLQPEIIGSLPSLQELWLDCNELKELPPVSQVHVFKIFTLLVISAMMSIRKILTFISRSNHV